MNKGPLFSVLMANYNNARFIEAAIESVRAQTYQNWELVIVDDASTDQSWDIMSSYSKADDRIKIYRNEFNLKVGATKAICAQMATGEICGILDPDDLITSDALEIMALAHQKHPDCSLISSDLYLCDEDLNMLPSEVYLRDTEKFRSYLEDHCGSVHAFWTFKKSYYLKTKGFSEKYVLAEDQDLFYKLEEVGQTLAIPSQLYYYRIHKNSISKNDKTALAFAYHLYAMANALKRRGNNSTTNERIRVYASLIGFLEWGFHVIPLKHILLLIKKYLRLYPRLFCKKAFLVAFYLVITRSYFKTTN